MIIPTFAQAVVQIRSDLEIDEGQTKNTPQSIRYFPLGVEVVETEGPNAHGYVDPPWC